MTLSVAENMALEAVRDGDYQSVLHDDVRSGLDKLLPLAMALPDLRIAINKGIDLLQENRRRDLGYELYTLVAWIDGDWPA